MTYDVVRQQRPDIVYVTVSAFGSPGPWTGWPGYEVQAQAASGLRYAGLCAAHRSAVRGQRLRHRPLWRFRRRPGPLRASSNRARPASRSGAGIHRDLPPVRWSQRRHPPDPRLESAAAPVPGQRRVVVSGCRARPPFPIDAGPLGTRPGGASFGPQRWKPGWSVSHARASAPTAWCQSPSSCATRGSPAWPEPHPRARHRREHHQRRTGCQALTHSGPARPSDAHPRCRRRRRPARPEPRVAARPTAGSGRGWYREPQAGEHLVAQLHCQLPTASSLSLTNRWKPGSNVGATRRQ